MALISPKRLFHVPSMSTVMYGDVVGDVVMKGYIAVSHVWGEQKVYSATELGVKSGVYWKIPLSDPNKVRRLVDAMNHYDMEYCWWDILCMPQDKQDEINLEIPFMGDYYSGASITFVLSDVNYNTSGEYTEWYDMISDVMASRRDFTKDEDMWILSKNHNLLDISKDKWFTRVWTLQEGVLSKKIILAGNSTYFNLSNMVNKLPFISSKGEIHMTKLFGDSAVPLLTLGDVTKGHKEGTLDLISVLNTNGRRDCYKIHDRFYGVFGILGYKDFAVDYNMEIDDLNRYVAQYSYSKGDISWMSVGGSVGAGFVQPMYKPFPYIGMSWEKDTPDGRAAIIDGVVHVRTAMFGTVTRCEKIPKFSNNLDDVIAPIVRIFAEWGIGSSDAFHTITEHSIRSDRYIDIGTDILISVCNGNTLEKAIDDLRKSPEGYEHRDLANFLFKFFSIGTVYNTLAAVSTNVVELGENFPLIVSGNVNVGDRIVFLEIHDVIGRALGVVVSESSQRKGICIIPRTRSMFECPRFKSHKFLL